MSVRIVPRTQWPTVAIVAALVALLALPLRVAVAQVARPAGIVLRTVAQVEPKAATAGSPPSRLLEADHVVAGDQLIYTLEIRNTTSHPLAGVIATNPIPERMGYVAGSAQGPGADVDFSVDGGLTFGKPEALRIKLAGGQSRPAAAADYTHIRWTLKYSLRGNSTAFARFRASLK